MGKRDVGTSTLSRLERSICIYMRKYHTGVEAIHGLGEAACAQGSIAVSGKHSRIYLSARKLRPLLLVITAAIVSRIAQLVYLLVEKRSRLLYSPSIQKDPRPVKDHNRKLATMTE